VIPAVLEGAVLPGGQVRRAVYWRVYWQRFAWRSGVAERGLGAVANLMRITSIRYVLNLSSELPHIAFETEDLVTAKF
jgi:hypothetical protein